MVQMIADEIVDMIAMWDRFMTAVGAMDVRCIVPFTLVWGTIVGIGRTDFQNMLVVVPFVWMVQVPIVQIIDMAVMLDCGVAAVGAVLMIVMFVNVVSVGLCLAHKFLLLKFPERLY
jgi:hypothetical protein